MYLLPNRELKLFGVGPRFDIITYTTAMPTDLVGGIRRNLEQSHISPSNSNGYGSSSVDTRELYRQASSINFLLSPNRM